jgi:hypothetical protein
MAPRVATRALRVLAAAARLATLYGFGVLLLLSALVLWTGDWVGNIRGVLTLYGYVFGILLATAFPLLAAARRLGFAALWLLLIAVWVWPLARHGWTPVGVLAVFVFWSVAALPFYLLGAVGFPGRRGLLRLGRWTATVPAVVLALWVLLLLFTLAVTPAHHLLVTSSILAMGLEPPSAVLKLAPVVWAPVPILIGLEALVRLWPNRIAATEPAVSEASHGMGAERR